MKHPLLLTTACGMLLAAAAQVGAQTQTASEQASTKKVKDPNKVICQRIEEIGSRLSSKRVCMTAQQWEEQRRQQRENIEDMQRRQNEPSIG